jgi:hypothetical protein
MQSHESAGYQSFHQPGAWTTTIRDYHDGLRMMQHDDDEERIPVPHIARWLVLASARWTSGLCRRKYLLLPHSL